ncbi:MAG: Folylpolyglutamate synthase [Chlamydiales bacterium]|nr:Folylpolyglutamate synthase [Chlamydiales bacterium]MCH9634965.1 Folylpolyglutamate synthase [Chlamydiales bacterium]MCH9704424.1 hypothetical protein [Chlamydiota bacterium]
MHSANEMAQMKLGVEAIAEIDASLGRPSAAYPTIHVAGTNGKGSVCTKIARSLELAGKKVGLFTSPHISCISERIQINGRRIPLEDLNRLWIKDLTYFESVTLAAFRFFAEQQVDIAVIEVGLGGRLDATNIITPILSVITSIDFDHQEFLGNTLESIAKEKAAIIKRGVPAVMGPHVKPRHLFPKEHWVEVSGSYEEENCAIAAKALEILGYPPLGMDAKPPCRFEQIGHLIFDGAHNPAALKRTLERVPRPFACLAAFSKNGDEMRALLHEAQPLVVTEIDHERILPGDERDFSKAFTSVYNSDCLLVTGSLYIMERAKLCLEEAQKAELSKHS